MHPRAYGSPVSLSLHHLIPQSYDFSHEPPGILETYEMCRRVDMESNGSVVGLPNSRDSRSNLNLQVSGPGRGHKRDTGLSTEMKKHDDLSDNKYTNSLILIH